jgi:hypothetical protein
VGLDQRRTWKTLLASLRGFGIINSPSPADDIDEPSSEWSSDAAAQSGNQVDVGTPLGNLSDREEVYACQRRSLIEE